MQEDRKVISSDAVKYLAIFLMTLNHICNIGVIPEGTFLYEFMTDIGYFTAPVMCWFLVNGYKNTSSVKKYFLRLVIFGAIAQIPVHYCFGNISPNILLNFAWAILIMVVMDSKMPKALRIILTVLMLIISFAFDWGLVADLIVVLLKLAKTDKTRFLSFLAGLAVFALLNTLMYRTGAYNNYSYPLAEAALHGILSAVPGIIAALTVIFFMKPGKKHRGFGKWFFYIYYPLHIYVLWLIKILIF